MATKTAAKTTKKDAKRVSKGGAKAKPAARATTAKRAPPKAAPRAAPKSASPAEQLAALAKAATPEQIFDLYKTNAKAALDVIHAMLESSSKLRRLQFDGEESARELGRRTAESIASAQNPSEDRRECSCTAPD